MKRLAVTLGVCADLLAVLVCILVWTGFGVHSRSRSTLRIAASQAAVAVSNAPTQSCNPPIGGGTLGACAPVQAFAATDAIAKAAGDPDVITGHPLGVDVSSNNGCRHFSKADAFVFIKATESVGYTSPCLAGDVAYAKSLGVPYGVYDFLRPGYSSADAEARHFVAAVLAAHANTSLPPVADVEVNAGLSPSQLRAYVGTWDQLVRSLLKRTVVITYTGAWFWTPSVGGSAAGDLWVSGYGSSVTAPSSWTVTRTVAPFGSIAWTFWQYSDGTYGPTPHLGADSDVFGGTQAQLDALAVTTFVGYKPPSRPSRPSTTTTVTRTATTAARLPKGAVCFGKGAKPKTKGCQAVIRRHMWLVDRRVFWHRQWHECVWYENQIGCSRALRWYVTRRRQAIKLHNRYSR